MLHENLAESERPLVILGVVGWIVVPMFLDGGEAARLRCIPQEEEHEDRNARGDESIEIKLRAPIVKEEDAEQGKMGYESAADVVRAVPKRNDQPTFLRAEPMHHGLSARRPAHALHPAVNDLEADDDCQGTVNRLRRPADEHDNAGKQEAKRKKPSRIASVGNRAHEEFRSTIGDRECRECGAELGLGVFRVLLEDIRNGQREIVANEVIARISDENSGKDLPAQPSVGR